MRKLNLFTRCTVLATMPALFAYPQDHLPHVSQSVMTDGRYQEVGEWIQPTTYDEIIQFLEDLESGQLERKCSPKELEKVNDYLAILAKEGILPGEFEEAVALERDINELRYGEDSRFQLAHYLENCWDYTIISATLSDYSDYDIVQCGKISKAWKRTKKFAKKHKKEIIIGAVVVVAVVAVSVAVVATSSVVAVSAISSAAGAAGAAASGSNQSELSSLEMPVYESILDERISSFKENLAQENFFDPSIIMGEALSLEETGRVLGPLFAHDSLNHLAKQLPNNPQLSQEIQGFCLQADVSLPADATGNLMDDGHHEIDRRFSSDCGPMFSDPDKEVNFNALTYQMRGEVAHSYGYCGQAVNDLTKAISMNPTDPMPYLQRSASYFDMGQYDESIKDFNNFAAQIKKGPEEIPFSTAEFTLGFAKGLPKGVYESGKGIMLFLGDLVTHPIYTATQMYDALSILAGLAREDQWGVIGEVLSPEIYLLVTQWDTLPSAERGELAGYAFGKHGADIVAPGAVAKIASKSVKSARELAAVLKNLQMAEGTLVLETVAGVGNTAQVGEIINAGKTSAFLGEELGFTAKEMGQLQKAGKLEGAINSRLDRLVSQAESEVFKAAISKDSHVKMVRDYLEKPAKEIQKGIRSYEKQIALHLEKIANPSKFIPHWDKLHPERQHALVSKKWPAEIQCYTEQRDVLQSILNERLK